MRRISKGALLAVALAVAVAALCVVAWMRLSAMPPVATLVPITFAPRLLVVSSPDGVLVVEPQGAYRVAPDLTTTAVDWPLGLYVERVRSAAYNRGKLALVWSGVSADRAERDGLLVIDGTHVEVSHYADRLIAVRAAAGGFETYIIEQGRLLRADVGADGRAAPVETAPHLKLSAVEGMTFHDGEPVLLVGERGAQWRVTRQGRVLGMPAGARAVWSASALLPLRRDPRVRFVDEHDEVMMSSSALPYHGFVVRGDRELVPLTVSAHGSGSIESRLDTWVVEIERKQHRLRVAPDGSTASWRTVATPLFADDFVAWPVGAHHLALGATTPQAVMLDDTGRNLHPASAEDTLSVITHGRAALIRFRLLILLMGTLLLPLSLLLAVRRLRIIDRGAARADEPHARGVFIGTLRVPPGVAVQTEASGRAALSGTCQLVSGGVTLDLDAGPLRVDRGVRTPLVDGEQVYVVGRLESDDQGGPMRASHRKRVVSDGRRYLIGRGGLRDFERDVAARESRALLAVAVCQLAFGLLTLLGMGLRPFM
jgi:hypothetical protein